MTARLAVLGRRLGGRDGGLGSALREALPSAQTVVVPERHETAALALVALAKSRPHLVFADAFAPSARAAALYRAAAPRSRLLLCATELSRPLRALDRWVLARADGIVADGDAVVRFAERLRFPAPVLSSMRIPADLDLFLSAPRHRFGPVACRLLHVGPLSPESGAADILIALAAWAEDHPKREAEIWWTGQGDLAGVLAAQPLPPNLQQRFLPTPDRSALADACGQCGIAILPFTAGLEPPPLAELLAAGLPLLGSCRSAAVRAVLRAGAPGWTFDPLEPADLAQAVSAALGLGADELNQLREAGRTVVCESVRTGLADRLREAAFTILPPGRLSTDPSTP